MPTPPSSETPSKKRPADLLPNEQEISYDSIHNFFIRNKTWIVGLGFLLILVGVGYLAWQLQEDKVRKNAEEQLAQAQSVDELEKIVRNYPGAQPALLALMSLGDLYYQQGEWDRAASAYSSVLMQFGASPMTPSAAVCMAAILEGRGKVSEAIEAYRKIVSTYPKSFQAPQALFAAARLMQDRGQLQEARLLFEELLSAYPNTAWKGQAALRLQKINSAIKTASAKPAAPSALPAVSNPPPRQKR